MFSVYSMGVWNTKQVENEDVVMTREKADLMLHCYITKSIIDRKTPILCYILD